MRFLLPQNIQRAALTATLLAGAALIAGCAAFNGPQSSVTSSDRASPSDEIPVIRSGRYTLVELVPDPVQQDLMHQVVDLTVPAASTATVGDALRYALLRSGYQLCDENEELRALNALPLPAAHTHLGPLILRDALQLLAGPAWKLQIDEATRRVCFTRQP